MNTSGDQEEVPLTPEAARDFRLQFQQARESALKDAEAFDGIIHVMERLGSVCLRRVAGLSEYRPQLQILAQLSPLATDIPARWRSFHTPFSELFTLIKEARNDAVHIGSYARHLTAHAVDLALVMEDALKAIEKNGLVSDYMIRDPVCAQLWQPISLIRQRMLTNSFSFLPVRTTAGQWCLVSDLQVARYLRGCSNNDRKRRLATPLGEAKDIVLKAPKHVGDATPLSEIIGDFNGTPILVVQEHSSDELMGIITAFDLL